MPHRIKDYILPRGLFVRSLLILITPVILLLGITSIVFVDNHWNRMSDRLAESVVGEIIWLSDMVENSRFSYIDIQSYAKRHLEMVLNFDENANLPVSHDVSGGWEQIILTSLSKAMDKKTERPYRVRIDHYKENIILQTKLNSGVLTFEIPPRRVFSSSAYIFLIWMLLSSIVLVSIATIFMRNQIRPIRALSKATERYGKGQDTGDFKPYGAREVRQAARAFLDMKDRINRQIAQRTTMLAAVSHDLRTPMTRLKLSLSMLPENEDTKAMKDDIIDMEHMIDGYLNFAQGVDEDETSQEIDLQDFLSEVIADIKRAKIDIEINSEINAPLIIKPKSLERALNNFITNADKYGENVWLSTSLKEDMVIITIEDDGPGISEDLYEDVFKPFFRVDESRNSETGGVGLGMSIAQDIVLSHGGCIKLDKSAHGGLKVNLYLPL